MPRLTANEPAPHFCLLTYRREPVSLVDFLGQKHVLIVFNRGFTWPYCREHLAQLRRDYDQFVARDIEILVIGPENATAFERYWEEEKLPFTGLPDPRHSVIKLYGQEVKLFKLGRMPAQILVDKAGIARYVHYGGDMKDILTNEQILALVDELNAEAPKGRG